MVSYFLSVSSRNDIVHLLVDYSPKTEFRARGFLVKEKSKIRISKSETNPNIK
jgi:hypothetical protein